MTGRRVTWRASDVPKQTFGRVGRIDMFVVGRDAEGGDGYILGTRGLTGSDRGLIGFADTVYPDARAAQEAAEAEIARILAELDRLKGDLTGE